MKRGAFLGGLAAAPLAPSIRFAALTGYVYKWRRFERWTDPQTGEQWVNFSARRTVEKVPFGSWRFLDPKRAFLAVPVHATYYDGTEADVQRIIPFQSWGASARLQDESLLRKAVAHAGW